MNPTFHLYGMKITLAGDLQAAKDRAHLARLLMFKTKLVNVNNLDIIQNNLRLDDGTHVHFMSQHGFDSATIYVPQRVKEKKKERKETKRRLLPFVFASENSFDSGGILVFNSGFDVSKPGYTLFSPYGKDSDDPLMQYQPYNFESFALLEETLIKYEPIYSYPNADSDTLINEVMPIDDSNLDSGVRAAYLPTYENREVDRIGGGGVLSTDREVEFNDEVIIEYTRIQTNLGTTFTWDTPNVENYGFVADPDDKNQNVLFYVYSTNVGEDENAGVLLSRVQTKTMHVRGLGFDTTIPWVWDYVEPIGEEVDEPQLGVTHGGGGRARLHKVGDKYICVFTLLNQSNHIIGCIVEGEGVYSMNVIDGLEVFGEGRQIFQHDDDFTYHPTMGLVTLDTTTVIKEQ